MGYENSDWECQNTPWKSLYFVNRHNDQSTKIGHTFRNIKCIKMGVSTNVSIKSCSPRLFPFDKNQFQKDSDDLLSYKIVCNVLF